MVRKIDAAVETGRDMECTLELVWTWACELGKDWLNGKQRSQMTFLTWT